VAGKHIIVSGKVQGVFFRQSTKEQADRLGLRGWVRNNADGSVEIAVFGGQEAIASFIGWCRQGPPGAAVSDVQVESLANQTYEGFTIDR
jgi:acylphosphatase